MQRPTGITIIAILLAISGVVSVVIGLSAAGVYDLGMGGTTGNEAQGWADVIVGVITLLVSYGLWTLAGWAWTISVVVVGIRVLIGVWAVVVQGLDSSIGVQALVQAVVNVLILLYLFSGGVRAAFSRA